MADASITKVEAGQAQQGPQGQRYLAGGEALSMRLWDREPPNDGKHSARREYETVGYVISGRATLTVEGRSVTLQPGSSWVVPKGAEHSYRIEEAFTAVEATHPPAEAGSRDAA